MPNLPELALKVNIPDLKIIKVPDVEVSGRVDIKPVEVPKISDVVIDGKVNIEPVKVPEIPEVKTKVSLDTSDLKAQFTTVESLLADVKKSAQDFGQGSKLRT